ncbi:efflux RND transporter permease subunit, partial [Acinetobacter baumannii]
GKLFTEFALTLAGAVIISGFVALTLTPMMCSRLLVAHDEGRENENRILKVYHAFSDKVGHWLDQLDQGYGYLLTRVLEK